MDFKELRDRLIEKDFSNMNSRQFDAVTSVSGPLLVLAGAGSGKTTVLVNRIANLVKYGSAYHSDYIPQYTEEDLAAGEDYLNGRTDSLPAGVFSVRAPRPWEILAITFTNKAANELKERITARLGEGGESLWAGTFHSVCGKILRRNAERIGYTSNFTIYDTDDQRRLMKLIIKDEGIDEKFLPHKAVLSAISAAKNELISPEEMLKMSGSDSRQNKIAQLYAIYSNRMRAANAMDFDDMICETVNLLKNNPDVLEYYGSKFRYIMVDEYQDTNHAQYVLISLLASVNGNLCVVGDDDQSIYRFRGATIENILNFEDEFTNAKTIRLEQNYRSTGNILDAANAVISHNLGRKGKELWTESGEGEKIKLYDATDERSEAAWVVQQILDGVQAGNKFSDNAVLYRMNAQSAAVENVLVRSGIAYRIVGGHKFFDRKEIKDVLAYLQLINNNNDDIRLRRVINEPKRGIGETTVTKASDIAQSLRLSLFEVFLNASDYPSVSRAGARLREFCDMIRQLSQLSAELSISELYEKMLALTGYRGALLADDSAESRDRLENVNEFASMIKQYEQESEEPSLSEFLEQIALFTDLDTLDDNDDRVVLMTIHSAKGLEFNRVFLIGMEEGIFPGMQSVYGGAAEIEEERRLAYVAITRARRQLFISRAQSRLFFGKTDRNLPSRFLKEIPEELCESCSPVFRYQSENRYGGGYSVNRRSGGFGESVSGHTEISFSNRPPESPKPQTGNKKYTVGQRVEHTVFGNGVICSVTPMGGDLLLGITFEKSGNKKIMASYAKLKIL